MYQDSNSHPNDIKTDKLSAKCTGKYTYKSGDKDYNEAYKVFIKDISTDHIVDNSTKSGN